MRKNGVMHFVELITGEHVDEVSITMAEVF
jgi:hypothetical protein